MLNLPGSCKVEEEEEPERRLPKETTNKVSYNKI